MPQRLDPRRFDLQGHRGARGLAPENTLPAFAKAMEIGTDTLELDTAVTRDGVVVVAHDRRLNPDITRGPDGRWLKPPTPTVNSMSFAELRALDVGRIDPHSDYFRRFPEQQGMDGVTMPTLLEVFDLVRLQRNDRVRFNIETKLSPIHPMETPPPEEFVSALLGCITAANIADRVTIQSFDWRVCRLVRARNPEMRVSYLSTQQAGVSTIGEGADSRWTDGIEYRRHHSVPRMIASAARCSPGTALQGVVWSPHFADLSEAAVKDAHALNIEVLPWTLNDPADMARSIAMGIDGLITDYPDRARAVLAKAGILLPPALPLP